MRKCWNFQHFSTGVCSGVFWEDFRPEVEHRGLEFGGDDQKLIDSVSEDDNLPQQTTPTDMYVEGQTVHHTHHCRVKAKKEVEITPKVFWAIIYIQSITQSYDMCRDRLVVGVCN